MCLNSSNVVEPMTRSSPAVRIGLMSVARSIVPPVVAPAPTVEWISSMKRIGLRPLARSARDDRLEALLEVAAEARARRAAPPVSSAKTSAPFSASGTSSASSRDGEPFGHRRLADAGVADEHRVVLAAPAEDFDRALQLGGAADQRIEQRPARARSVRFDAVGAERIARRRRPFVAAAGRRPPCAPAPGVLGGRHLRDAVRDVFEDVEPRDALLGEQLRRVRLRLLQDGGEDVARLRLRRAARSARAAPPSAARGGTPPSAPARAASPRGSCSSDSSRYASRSRAQPRQIGAAGGEDPLAVGVVRQRVEQVLEREVGVPPRDRFAVRDGEDDFDGGGKHGSAHASSMAARSGKLGLSGQRRRPSRLSFRRLPTDTRRRSHCRSGAPAS